MTAHAPFAHRFVLKDKRAALRGMTLETSLVVAEQGGAAALEALRQIRAAAFDGIAFVRVVAIRAADFAFEHRMMMRQLEFRADLHVALKTRGRRFSRIDNRAFLAAALDVEAARSVTRFAADVFGVVALRLQARMRRGRETFGDRFVAGRAFFRADKLGARNARRSEDGAARFEVAAGKKDNR